MGRGCVDLERAKDPLKKEGFCSSSGARYLCVEAGLVVVRGNMSRDFGDEKETDEMESAEWVGGCKSEPSGYGCPLTAVLRR